MRMILILLLVIVNLVFANEIPQINKIGRQKYVKFDSLLIISSQFESKTNTFIYIVQTKEKIPTVYIYEIDYEQDSIRIISSYKFKDSTEHARFEGIYHTVMYRKNYLYYIKSDNVIISIRQLPKLDIGYYESKYNYIYYLIDFYNATFKEYILPSNKVCFSFEIEPLYFSFFQFSSNLHFYHSFRDLLVQGKSRNGEMRYNILSYNPNLKKFEVNSNLKNVIINNGKNFSAESGYYYILSYNEDGSGYNPRKNPTSYNFNKINLKGTNKNITNNYSVLYKAKEYSKNYYTLTNKGISSYDTSGVVKYYDTNSNSNIGHYSYLYPESENYLFLKVTPNNKFALNKSKLFDISKYIQIDTLELLGNKFNTFFHIDSDVNSQFLNDSSIHYSNSNFAFYYKPQYRYTVPAPSLIFNRKNYYLTNDSIEFKVINSEYGSDYKWYINGKFISDEIQSKYILLDTGKTELKLVYKAQEGYIDTVFTDFFVYYKLKANFIIEKDYGNYPLEVKLIDKSFGNVKSQKWYINDNLIQTNMLSSVTFNAIQGKYILKTVIANELDKDTYSDTIIVDNKPSIFSDTLFFPNANYEKVALGIDDDLIVTNSTYRKTYRRYHIMIGGNISPPIWQTQHETINILQTNFNIINQRRNLNVKGVFDSLCFYDNGFILPIIIPKKELYYYAFNNPLYYTGSINSKINENLNLLVASNNLCLNHPYLWTGLVEYKIFANFCVIDTFAIPFLTTRINQDLKTLIPMPQEYVPSYSIAMPKSLLQAKDTNSLTYNTYFSKLSMNSTPFQFQNTLVYWNRNKLFKYNYETKLIDTSTYYSDGSFKVVGTTNNFCFTLEVESQDLTYYLSINSIQYGTSKLTKVEFPVAIRFNHAYVTDNGNLFLVGDSLKIPIYKLFNENLKLIKEGTINSDGLKATIVDVRESKGKFTFLTKFLPEVIIGTTSYYNYSTDNLHCYIRDTLSIDEPLIIETISEDKTHSLSPNPVSDYLLVNGDFSNYEITDLTGKIIKSGNYSHVIDLTTVNTGIYLIKLLNNNSFDVLKFIKQ